MAKRIATTSEMILSEVESYLAATGTAASAFGVAVAKDPSLVGDLRRGERDIKASMIDTIRKYMRENPAPPQMRT